MEDNRILYPPTYAEAYEKPVVFLAGPI